MEENDELDRYKALCMDMMMLMMRKFLIADAIKIVKRCEDTQLLEVLKSVNERVEEKIREFECQHEDCAATFKSGIELCADYMRKWHTLKEAQFTLSWVEPVLRDLYVSESYIQRVNNIYDTLKREVEEAREKIQRERERWNPITDRGK